MSQFFKLGTDASAVLDALSRSQAIIEFDLTGKILKANDNFCKAVGYQQSEIIGRPHSMFLSPEDAASPEYKAFWAKLSRGEYDQGQYRRRSKTGDDIWIEASYNPVFVSANLTRWSRSLPISLRRSAEAPRITASWQRFRVRRR